MKTITSRDNPLYKRLKLLAHSTQQLRRSGQALLEGAHLAAVYLDKAGQPQTCVVAESALRLDEIQALIARVEPPRMVTLADALFAQISTLAQGLGILLLIEPPAPVLPPCIDAGCVILDRVQDAGNVGSILRSAAAAGIGQVFCAPGTALPWSAKVLRAGMGAHFLLTIHEQIDTAALAAQLAIPVAITDSHGAAPLYDCDLTGPLAWVFGNEGVGVSPEWRAAAARRVTIPQPGGMESLNVAAAAAICLFEQCRQQRGAA